MATLSVSPAGKKPATSGKDKKKPKRPLTPFPGEQERRRKALIERFILGATLTFCVLVISAVWYSEGKVLDGTTRFLAQFAGKDAQSPRDFAQNCRHPKNRNTPYCLERTAEIDASWQSMSKNQEGKANPFTLHEK